MNKLVLQLENLSCSSCANKIEDRISKLSFIDKVHVNFLKQTVTIVYSNQKESEVIKVVTTIIKDIESDVIINSTQKNNLKNYNKYNIKFLRLIVGVSLILLMFFTEFRFELYIAIITYIIFGYDVVYKAIKNILKKDFFDENFLMSFATICALAIGEVNEAIAVMLFYQFGEYFQDLAVGNSRASIENLMDFSIDRANLFKDNTIIEVEPSDLKINDIIVVKVGEKIPIDGTIINGETQLDTSSITGENIPKTIKENDSVISGTINLNSVIKVRVDKLYQDSTVSQIIELIDNASENKAETEKFITKFSKIYTPIVLILALLLTLIPTLINPSAFNEWFYRSLVFLVISCPCALVVSVPLTFYSGIGFASKNGILVKGGTYLQALTNTTKIVFDKTGTLTKGVFTVTGFNTTINENDFFNILYNNEKHSNHPIAKSIVNYAKQHYNLNEINYKIEEVAGKGLIGSNNNEIVLIGNQKLLNQIKIETINSNGTCIYVALNNNYIGHVIVSDIIKEEAKAAIKSLKDNHIETYMLTGDNSIEANYVAKTLGIDQVKSELLPQDKVAIFNDIRSNNEGATVFVGDGVNDAPVLKNSDVGIAMGALGSENAIEASDIVIMNDDLSNINKAIRVAKSTLKIAKQNIALALILKLIILSLGLFGLTSMWLAIFADVGVTLLAVLNASRKK